MVTHVTLLGMETITSQRMTATRRSTFWLFGPILSLVLLLPLLRSAAKLDIHYVDKNQPPYGDYRFYGGLFLLYGFCAAIPSLATAVVSSRFRKLSIKRRGSLSPSGERLRDRGHLRSPTMVHILIPGCARQSHCGLAH